MLTIIVQVDAPPGQAIGIKEDLAQHLERFGDAKVVSVADERSLYHVHLHHSALDSSPPICPSLVLCPAGNSGPDKSNQGGNGLKKIAARGRSPRLNAASPREPVTSPDNAE